MAVVLNASHFLLDARLADDCSDYFCNKSATHKPSIPSHRVFVSRDGGRTFRALYDVGGRSAWSATDGAERELTAHEQGEDTPPEAAGTRTSSWQTRSRIWRARRPRHTPW